MAHNAVSSQTLERVVIVMERSWWNHDTCEKQVHCLISIWDPGITACHLTRIRSCQSVAVITVIRPNRIGFTYSSPMREGSVVRLIVNDNYISHEVGTAYRQENN
ncbi:hypothetical protein TNIN_35521 [Trichonephila inaurata madagascariensis]|uniref:Uncharacterized protein n=1 Tax=Trichonephila inaurata madagascariensis TaxID=2747483 RepID=A0A8X6Y3F6_9ARAC|nr:hypothetical protein TNIN_35521 [Trichonephila inaurata madagascariensis]